jgi:hypothetical protein
MHTEVAGDQNYDDHYANYSKDVHSVVLQLRDNRMRRASTPHVPHIELLSLMQNLENIKLCYHLLRYP